MNRIIGFILAGTVAGSLFLSCTEKEAEIAVSSVSISQPTAELLIGETVKLSAIISPSNATSKEVVWAASKQSVATVSQDGLVTAITEGTSNITATAGGKVGSCVVTVSKGVITVTSIELNKSSLELVEGDSATLSATIKPDDATDKTVTWTTSDASIVTVDGGKVQAQKEGQAIITAKAGDKTATCTVVVAKKVIPVTSISLDNTSLSLKEGQEAQLIATVKPDDATDKTVSWNSDKTNVATVDNTGKVKAIAEGTATIIAKAGDKTATCSVEVSKNVIAVTSITLDKTTLSLTKGEESQLVATVKPDNATDKTVTWTTSDASIVTVNTGKVKAVKSGTASITAKAGEKSATCVISVTTPVESITLDSNSATLEEGQSITLTATINPTDADEKTITWSTSNETVATVNQDGKVTAVSKGTATIKAVAQDGSGRYATCSVSVIRLVSSIVLDKTSFVLYNGYPQRITATVSPADASNTGITWTSSDSSIATVSSSGVVTGKTAGNVTITAKAKDASGKEASCEVEVRQYVTSVELDKTSLSLNEGEDFTLAASVTPDNASEKTLAWSSSDESVATVDQTGKVTAVSKGTATIKAVAQDGSGRYATCSVSVIRLVSSIVLDKTSFVLYNGYPQRITATVSPADASNTGITWTSSNTSIASVSSTGVVMAMGAGNVTITAKAKDASGKEASCEVEVRLYVTGITLDKSDLSLVPGESYTLVATVSPSDAYDKTLTWTSSDTSVATVDAGGVVRAVADGTTTITAVANDDSGKQATCSVSVESPYTAIAGKAVDMGLSVKWSSWNLGATKPEEYGDYFAWGEIEPNYLNGHSQDSPCSSWRNGKTGYNSDSYQYENEGDTARAVLGGNWRTPTDAEWTELRNYCSWTWDDNYNSTGVAGYNVRSWRTGNCIFLPAAGGRNDSFLNGAGSSGIYWSSSIRTVSPHCAWRVRFYSGNIYRESDIRCYGRSIRPVTE